MFNAPEFWNTFTDILVALALLDLATIFVAAVRQWVKRKSFNKIDRELRWVALPIALMAITYLIFEKFFIISYRPLASGHPEEPSFPSTHVMLAATIFFTTIVLLPKYLKNRTDRLNLSAAMLVATILIAIGRVLAHMHWVTDVLGGLAFGALFAAIYALVLRYLTPRSKSSKSSPKTPSKSHPTQVLPS